MTAAWSWSWAVYRCRQVAVCNPPEMTRRRAKVAAVEVEETARIVEWLKSRPGVFGPFRDQTSVWQEALRAFGNSQCGLGFFQFNLRRIGYGVEEVSGGYRLDLSDPALVLEAE